MKKIIQVLCLVMLSANLYAKETITVATYNSASGTLIPYYNKILDEANKIQNKYQFLLLPKPGAQGLIALQFIDQSPLNRLAVTTSSFVDLSTSNQLNQKDYTPVSSQGDACWVLISNFGDANKGIGSLKGKTSLFLGTVAHGSSAHYTALDIGSRLGIDITPVIFKSNFEALTLMASDGSINLVIESPQNYLNFKQQNPKLQALGVTCSVRNPKLPNVKTLKEQGYNTPKIWQIIVANNKMPAEKQKELGNIIDQAMIRIGQKQIYNLIDFSVPVFQKISASQHFEDSIGQNLYFRHKYENKLNK